jgi:tetratricopeptide (TPR) repeat protein
MEALTIHLIAVSRYGLGGVASFDFKRLSFFRIRRRLIASQVKIFLRVFLQFIFISSYSYGQNELKQLLRYGDELFEKGDYHYAKNYYEQAMQIDSQTLSIQWRYAQILTSYQDYRGAANMYGKIFRKDGDFQYANCGLNFAKMLQQQGRYPEAIEILEKVLRSQGKEKKSSKTLWVLRLLESSKWAINNQEPKENFVLKNLPEPLNSKHAEFPHAILNKNLYFSSLRTDSIQKSEEVYAKQYRSRIFMTPALSNSAVLPVSDLNLASIHTGNGSFSLDSSRYYFSRCDDGKIPYTCKIYVAQHSNGRFTHIDVLGEVVNDSEASTTQPTIAKINNDEYLFFVSNRQGGVGAMDLYYSIIKNGTQFSKPKNLKSLNTIGDEITPFFHSDSKTLYFSSDFHVGFGGFDIFKAELTSKEMEFSSPVNLGVPFNSPENDTYLIAKDQEFYLASNRMGSMYAKNPTCCADIYKVVQKYDELIEEKTIVLVKNPEMRPLILPVLFFHNDSPNPKSRTTTTNLDYLSTYSAYLDLKSEYEFNWSQGKADPKDAQEQIQELFNLHIVKGVQDLEIFSKWLLEQLQKGAQLELVIRGFASPLTSSDYNVNLTMRRIESLVNHLERRENGILRPFVLGTSSSGGRMSYEKIPFGEYASSQMVSDNRTDVQNSVYSPEAALARRIEVKAVRFLEAGEPDAAVRVTNSKLDLGKIAPNSENNFTFNLISRSDELLELDHIEIPCDCIKFDNAIQVLNPRESMTLRGQFQSGNEKGPRLIPIELIFKTGTRVTVYLGMDVE